MKAKNYSPDDYRVRVVLPVETYAAFEARCTQDGISIGDRTRILISSFIETGKTPDKLAQEVAILTDNLRMGRARLAVAASQVEELRQEAADLRTVIDSIRSKLAPVLFSSGIR